RAAGPVRVGSATMVQRPVVREAVGKATGTTVEVLDTSGALGAAIGAGIGTGHFQSRAEAVKNIDKITTLYPEPEKEQAYSEAYEKWKSVLQQELSTEG